MTGNGSWGKCATFLRVGELGSTCKGEQRFSLAFGMIMIIIEALELDR
jgi:hypothetical protein